MSLMCTVSPGVGSVDVCLCQLDSTCVALVELCETHEPALPTLDVERRTYA